jgi:mono/diheme cytochrome c family protein
MIRKAYLILILASVALKLSAQNWEVPEDKLARVSSFKFSAETAKKGEAVFMKNCTSCHGIPTKGNFVKLVPPPGDPATDKFQKQTDGALFYKITTGRGAMPQFRDIVPEEDRWNVISYFRSFNKSYVQPAIEKSNLANAVQVRFVITGKKGEHKVQVLATDTLNKPLKNISVSLFAKRYFGNLLVGEAGNTNEKGIVMFTIPSKLPGDKDGNVVLIARQNGDAGDYKKTEILPVGVPTWKPPLTQPRAMWNIGIKAPVWLILSYSAVVLVVWGFLFYIISMIGKLRKAGENID